MPSRLIQWKRLADGAPTTTAVPYGLDSKHALAVLSANLFSSPTYFVRELISNAIDATALCTDPQRRRIKVTLRSGSRPKDTVLAVRDFGIGMSRDQMETVLPVFFRSTKSKSDSQKIGGFGIGLYASLFHASRVVVFSQQQEDADATEAMFGNEEVLFKTAQWKGPGTEVRVYLSDSAPECVRDIVAVSEFLQTTFPFSPVDIFAEDIVIGGPSRFDPPWKNCLTEPNWSPFLSSVSTGRKPDVLHCIKADDRVSGIAMFLVRKPLASEEQGIRLFVRNVLVDSAYCPSQNPYLLTFLSGAINAHHVELTLARDSVVGDHPSVAKLDEFFLGVLAKGLSDWARSHPGAFQEFVQNHRSNLLGACAISGRLCDCLHRQIPFMSHNGEWLSLTSADKTGRAFYAFYPFELAGLTRRHDLPGPVYLFESGAEQAFFRRLRSRTKVVWERIDTVYKPAPNGGLAFRAQQVKAALAGATMRVSPPRLGSDLDMLGTVASDRRIADVQVVDIIDDPRVAWLTTQPKPSVDSGKAENEVRKSLEQWGCREATDIFEQEFRRKFHDKTCERVLYLNVAHEPVRQFFAVLGSQTTEQQRIGAILLHALIAIARNTSFLDWPIFHSDLDDNRRVLEAVVGLLGDAGDKGSVLKGDEHERRD